MQADATVATTVTKAFRLRSIELHPDKHPEFCKRHKISDDQELLRPMLDTAFKALQRAKEFVGCWHAMGGEEYVPMEGDVQMAEMHIVLDGPEDEARGASNSSASGSSPIGSDDEEIDQTKRIRCGSDLEKSCMDCDEDGPRPFFDDCPGACESVGPLEYIGRDLLATFQSLLHASGHCIPEKWQNFQVEHLGIIHTFLQNCIDHRLPENGNQLPVPVSTLSSILEGKPDPSLFAFMVESLHNGVGSTRLCKRGWEQGTSSSFLKFDSRKVQEALLIGPVELEELRSSACSTALATIPKIMKNGAELTLATRTALLIFDESMGRLVHLYLSCRTESTDPCWTCKIWRVCEQGALAQQIPPRLTSQSASPWPNFLKLLVSCKTRADFTMYARM